MSDIRCPNPKCGSKYTYFSKKNKIYKCEECGYEFSVAQTSDHIKGLNYYTTDDYWCRNFWDVTPIPLAMSYYQLFTFVSENNLGCTLFSIRDVFELIIKIPITILFNGLHSFLEEKPEQIKKVFMNNKTVSKLFDYSLQMLVTGKWWECVRLASIIDDSVWDNLSDNKNEALLYKDTCAYLSKLYKLMYFQSYENQKIGMVTWRNRVLGHSCLSDDLENKQEDIPAILKMFKLVCDESLSYYNRICFANERSEELRGIKNAYTGSEVFILYKKSEIILIHHAFVVGKVYNLACFDGYEKGKGYFLNYENARRYKDLTLSELLLKHQTDLMGNSKILNSKDVFSDNIETIDIDSLEDILSEQNEIIGICSLFEWLMKNMQDNSKGLFLLESESGTGKSTFSSAIDQLDDASKLIMDENVFDNWQRFTEDVVIRVWHFASGYKERKDVFIPGIEDIVLTLNMDGSYGFTTKQYSMIRGNLVESWAGVITSEEEFRSLNLADSLNKTRTAYCNMRGTSKFLLVLDGVDEVSDSKELFSFIPDEEKLDDGVYILITCRTKEELALKSELVQELDDISWRKKLKFRIKDFLGSDNNIGSEYSRALRIYANDMLEEQKINQDNALVEKILNTIEYRFSSLSAYRGLCRLNPVFTTLLDSNIFNIYVKQLESKAPQSYVELTRAVLITLKCAGYPLNIRELAFLSGEYYVSYRLLGILSDLRAFISVTRSSSGNLYQISHSQWLYAINEWIMDAETIFLKECIRLLSEMDNYYNDSNILQLFDSTNVGEFWLVKNTYSLILNYKDTLSTDDVISIFKFMESILHKLFVCPKFVDIVTNELIEDKEKDNFWLFQVENNHYEIIDNFKHFSSWKESFYKIVNECHIEITLEDFFNLHFDVAQKIKSIDTKNEYSRNKALIHYQSGRLCLNYSSIGGYKMYEEAIRFFDKAFDAYYSPFGIFASKLHLQKATLYYKCRQYYAACFECLMIEPITTSDYEALSMEGKYILLQAYIILAQARSHFGNIIPFTEADNKMSYLSKANSIIDELLKSNICELYLRCKKIITDINEGTYPETLIEKNYIFPKKLSCFADYFLNLNIDIKREALFALDRKIGVNMDKFVIMKSLFLQLFAEEIKDLDFNYNLAATACFLFDCKKVILSDGTINNIDTYIYETSTFLYELGFDKDFIKICTQVNNYKKGEPREKESEVLEIIDRFTEMIADRTYSPAVNADDAILKLDDVLKGSNNHYIETFKEFINEMQQIYIY